MLSYLEYKQWHTEELDEATNSFFGKSHSTHTEDAVILNGKKGIAQALAGMLSIKKEFGKASSNAVTQKYDGIMLMAGWWQDKFFVANKGIFAKTPKINFSIEDIDKNHPSGPHDMLVQGFNLLKNMIPKGKIYQGDVLFSNGSKKEEMIDGKTYITFQPNTLVYAVEKDTPLGKKIANSDFGIVMHTKYNAVDAPDYVRLAGFGVSEKEFGKSSKVFLMDAYHQNVSSIVPFNQQEQSQWQSAFNSVKNMNVIELPDFVIKELMTFVNTYIRNGIIEPKSSQVVNEFEKWVHEKANKDILSKKTEKGQATAKSRWVPLFDYISANKKQIEKIIDARKLLSELKMMLIQKLEQVNSLSTFVKKTNGDIEVSASEGFVVCKTSGRALKLVDRYSFSYNNFSQDIIRGW